MKRRRRRERWWAFLTPLITLGSLVISIGLLMFSIRACGERLPYPKPFSPGGSRPPADVFPARP
jgi:hypothetical protein